MPVDPTPGTAFKEIRIIKHDDTNFKKGGGSDPVVESPQMNSYKIGAEFVNPVGMPSGPGFDGGKRKRKHSRVTRTFPKGILRKTHKVLPSKNPSKAPPTRKRSVLFISEKKIKEARKTTKAKAAKTDLGTIRKKLIDRKIIGADKKNIPPTVLRTLYADSVAAGLMN